MDLKLITLTLLVSIAVVTVPAQGRSWLPSGFFGKANEQPSYQYLVSFRVFDVFGKAESKHFCGGAILNERWIVSSASCFAGKYFASKIIAVVGAHGGQHSKKVHNIQRIVYHPGTTEEHNIVLIETTKPIAFNAHVKAIHVSDQLLEVVEDVSFVAWNATATDEEHSFVKYVKMSTMSNEDCEMLLQPKYGKHISDDMICAYGENDMTPHQNDAGYPLVWYDQLVGIAASEHSYGAGIPDLFTRISSYKNWIMETIAVDHFMDSQEWIESNDEWIGLHEYLP